MTKSPWSICPKDGEHFAIDPITGKGVCPCCHRVYSPEALKTLPHNAGICVPKGSPDAWGLGKQAFNINYMDDLQINMNHAVPAQLRHRPGAQRLCRKKQR